MTEFYLQVHCEFDSYYSVIIEDDGQVAYAYMYFGEDIVADVWLYNQAETPKETIWVKEKMPFLNPAEYVKKGIFISPLIDESEVRCEWIENSDGLIEVEILLRENFVAGMAAGSLPGWSALVVKDGPLAQVY